jgi:transcriptional regulator with XRE-family HTH domain
MASTKVRFGINIKRYMLRRNKTLMQLSRDIEVPKSTVQDWIAGRHLPYKHGYYRLSKALHTTPTKLLTEGE